MNENDNILASLAELEQNLKDIDSARQQVAEVVQSSKSLADIIASYKSSFEELAHNVNQALDKNKDLSLNMLSELSNITILLKDELSKLSAFEFDRKFQTLQQEFIRQIERSLSDKFSMMDEKIQALQEKAYQFQKQTTPRYESVDIDSYFEEHQKAFNELFGYLVQQDKRMQSRFVAVEDQLAEIDRRTMGLKNELKVNRIIHIAGIVVIVASILILHWVSSRA